MFDKTLQNTTVNPEDIAHVIGLLGTQYPVSRELQKELYKHAISISLEDGQHLLYQGHRCCYMYFIRRGALMGYTLHKQKQITTYISIENEFVSSLSGLYGEEPSREAIVAVEPTLVLGVHTDVLQGWYQRFFDLNFIIRKVYEKYYRDAQERSHIVRVGNAEERYLYFLKTKPGYIDRLSTDHIASFLDMKPETLLRIRKQVQATTDSKEVVDLIKQVEKYLEETTCFKEKTLKVQDLAKRIGVPAYKLSRTLNTFYGKNFSDFINQYRISYIKEHLKNEAYLQNYTLESLALQAGFASRSGFYKAFNKVEGITPKAYLATLKSS